MGWRSLWRAFESQGQLRWDELKKGQAPIKTGFSLLDIPGVTESSIQAIYLIFLQAKRPRLWLQSLRTPRQRGQRVGVGSNARGPTVRRYGHEEELHLALVSRLEFHHQ